jgi:aspartyl/asparaginyl beta-hydroxylase (cupin superfamily)|tara:strand:- start:1 stop:276 length:276 start_codon:yes stop_codon:yes gene_type:complete
MKKGIELPFGWTELFYVVALIVGVGFGYGNLVADINELREDVAESQEEISNLLDKHSVKEAAEREKLEDRVSFYEKEFNINPLSWKRKKKK